MNGPNQGHPIQLFVEHLSYANVVNLFVQLPSPRDHTTTLRLIDQRLQLDHADVSVSVDFPFALDVTGGDLSACSPNHATSSKTSRLQTEAGPLRTYNENVEPPWSASALGSETTIVCKSQVSSKSEPCGAHIIFPGTITDWRDLPSLGWADMMDIWHCHKPHEHDSPSNVNAKGYAAGNTQIARPGIGFIDPLRFMVDRGDCQNIEVRIAYDTLHSHGTSLAGGQKEGAPFGASWRAIALQGSSDTNVQNQEYRPHEHVESRAW